MALVNSASALPERKIRRGGYVGILTYCLISLLQANNIKLPNWMSEELVVLAVTGIVAYQTKNDAKEKGVITAVIGVVADEIGKELPHNKNGTP